MPQANFGTTATSSGCKKFFAVVLCAGSFAGMTATPLTSQEDFPIVGTYTENQACKNDGSEANVSRVRIGESEIESSAFGLCTIREREGNKFGVHVECKGAGGAMMASEVSFTIRDANTLDFADENNTYKAVLYKCAAR
jgi:hypothetical protein